MLLKRFSSALSGTIPLPPRHNGGHLKKSNLCGKIEDYYRHTLYTVLLLLHYKGTRQFYMYINIRIVQSGTLYFEKPFSKPLLSVSKPSKSNSLWIIMLLLSGDVEVNPGPETKWPCGICQYPVTWSQEGVACDSCELWHHKSCISLCSDDFQLLERSNVAWKCCKCDSINCDTFTFHSFELQSQIHFIR